MKFIQPLITDNVYGIDPVKTVYMAITSAQPQDGLTMENSKIISIIPAPMPSDTIVLDVSPSVIVNSNYLVRIELEKNNNINERYIYYYVRNTDVSTYVPQPTFTAAEIPVVQAIKTSKELLEYIAKKYNRNYRPEDFWVSDNSIDYTGGTVGPNWLMKARYNSIHYTGETIIRLHT